MKRKMKKVYWAVVGAPYNWKSNRIRIDYPQRGEPHLQVYNSKKSADNSRFSWQRSIPVHITPIKHPRKRKIN